MPKTRGPGTLALVSSWGVGVSLGSFPVCVTQALQGAASVSFSTILGPGCPLKDSSETLGVGPVEDSPQLQPLALRQSGTCGKWAPRWDSAVLRNELGVSGEGRHTPPL